VREVDVLVVFEVLSRGTVVQEVNKQLPTTRRRAETMNFFIRLWMSRRACSRLMGTASY
jgi:hypothetical protein